MLKPVPSIRSKLDLYINVTETKYSPKGFLNDPSYDYVFNNTTKEEKEQILTGFIRYIAVTMRKLLKTAIKEQYYKSWAPLSRKYLKFKKEHGLSEDIWRATGELYNHIIYRKVGDQYIIGIDPKAKYESGVLIYKVAFWMEYGTKYMPARPLFRPVTRFIKSYIRVYWEFYLNNPNKYLTQRQFLRIRAQEDAKYHRTKLQ